MMQIKCQICGQFQPVGSLDAHTQSAHGLEIEQKAIVTIRKTTEQVDYIYTHFPSALNNDGVLVEKCLQYFPLKSARAVYDQQTKQVTLTASIDDFFYCMKHVGSITRCGRAWRSKHTLSPDSKSAEREAQFAFSKGYWRKEGTLNEGTK